MDCTPDSHNPNSYIQSEFFQQIVHLEQLRLEDEENEIWKMHKHNLDSYFGELNWLYEPDDLVDDGNTNRKCIFTVMTGNHIHLLFPRNFESDNLVYLNITIPESTYGLLQVKYSYDNFNDIIDQYVYNFSHQIKDIYDALYFLNN